MCTSDEQRIIKILEEFYGKNKKVNCQKNSNDFVIKTGIRKRDTAVVKGKDYIVIYQKSKYGYQVETLWQIKNNHIDKVFGMKAKKVKNCISEFITEIFDEEVFICIKEKDIGVSFVYKINGHSRMELNKQLEEVERSIFLEEEYKLDLKQEELKFILGRNMILLEESGFLNF